MRTVILLVFYLIAGILYISYIFEPKIEEKLR